MKMSKLRVFSSLMLSSVAFAAGEVDPGIPQQFERQVSEARFEATKGDYGAGMAADGTSQDERSWFLTGALLYWRARVDGAEFGYLNQGVTDLPLAGESQYPKFGGDWGLKLGAGKHLSWDDWDVLLQYTFFRAHGKRYLSVGDGDVETGGPVIIPNRAAWSITSNQPILPKEFGFCTVANSDYRSRWHSFCLNLGRNSAVSKGLSLCPHLGVRYDMLKQKQTIYHTGGKEVKDVLGLGDSVVDVRDQTRFNGIGPQVGVHSQWHLGSGFNILGGVSSAYLLGRWRVSHHEDWVNDEEKTLDKASLSERQYGSAPTVQLQIGLHYDRAFQGCNQYINLGLDFETHYFWKQFQTIYLRSFFDKSKKQAHDVSMHGLTFRGTWNF